MTTLQNTTVSAAFDWAASRGEKWREQLVGMEAMLAPVDEPLLRALELEAPCRIADLGCGGGGTTYEILRRAPPGSVVHGFDISPALFESAGARAIANAAAPAFAIADVSTASAPGEPYDRLVSRFGVMFYDEPSIAFTNLARWLAPGGRFAFAVWGRLSDNPWLSIVREVAAQIVDLPTPDPDAPGPLRYAECDQLLSLLALAGFVELDVRDWQGTLSIGGALPAPEAAHFALRSFSVGERVLAAGDQAFARALQSLTERFVQHGGNDVVRLGASVHIVTGARSRAR